MGLIRLYLGWPLTLYIAQLSPLLKYFLWSCLGLRQIGKPCSLWLSEPYINVSEQIITWVSINHLCFKTTTVNTTMCLKPFAPPQIIRNRASFHALSPIEKGSMPHFGSIKFTTASLCFFNYLILKKFVCFQKNTLSSKHVDWDPLQLSPVMCYISHILITLPRRTWNATKTIKLLFSM